MLSAKTISLLVLCATLSACASVSPEDAKMSLALSAQGKALLAEGKKAEARDVYASAVKRNDENARAWNGLGVTNELLGKKTAAREAYQKALDLAPGDMTAANNLAHLYLAQNKAQEAYDLLKPFAGKRNAPEALRQNFAKAAQVLKDKEGQKPYADLGSFRTEGLAQGIAAKAQKSLDDSDLVFNVAPEVKKKDGTPVFTVKVTGAAPASVCERLKAKAVSCVARGGK